MIILDNDYLNLIKALGNPSNPNYSEKLHSITRFFIIGKASAIKERLNVGDFIYNSIQPIMSGLLMDYYPTLKRSRQISVAVESPNIEVFDDTVTIYQIYSKFMKDEKTGEEGMKYWCECYEKKSFSGESVESLLDEVYKVNTDPEYKVLEQNNLKDFQNLMFYQKNAKFPISYMVIKTCLSYRLLDPETSKKTINFWYFMGVDSSISAKKYVTMEEFKLLPMNDFGKTSELDIS